MSDVRGQQAEPPQDRTSFYQNDTGALPLMQGAEDMPDVTFGDAWRAGGLLARGERSSGERRRIEDAYRPILDVINRGKRRRIWRTNTDNRFRYSNPGEWAPAHEGGGGEREREEALIWGEIQRQRTADPKALPGVPATIDDFHRQINEGETKARSEARDTLSRSRGIGGWTAGLAGGLVQSMDDPLTIATLPIGGGGRTVAQRILLQGLANAAVEGVQLPVLTARRADFGETLTAGEAAAHVGIAAAFGAGIQGAVIEPLGALARRVIGAGRMTDAEAGAAHLIDREDEIAATSPFEPGHGTEVHFERLDMAMRAMGEEAPSRPIGPSDAVADAAPARAAPAPAAAGARETFMAHVRGAESSGNDAARNPRSSATGRYQFVDDTWLKYHRRVIGGEMTDAQRLAQRRDGAVQDRLMGALTDDNAKALARIGARETAGNLYLMHFAGERGGAKILKAAPDTPVETLLSKKAIAANPFLKGKTAADVVEWAHARMGGAAPDGPLLRRGNFADDEAGDLQWRAAQEMVDAEAAEAGAARGVAAALPDVEGAAPARAADLPERVDAIDATAEPLAVDLEAMPPRAQPPVAEQVAIAGFRTAKGSTYSVGEGGVTTRNKAFRPEHGAGEQGPQPTSERTIYVTKEEADQLAVFQSRGGAAMSVVVDAQTGHAAVRYVDGPDAGKLIRGTVVPARREPRIGLIPVELWRGGQRVHFGNEITQVLDAPTLRGGTAEAVQAGGDGVAPVRQSSEDAVAPVPRETFRAESDAAVAPEAARAFDDPHGEGAARQIESLEHDLRMAVDADPDLMVRLGDDGEPRALADILKEQDEEAAAIAAARACMAPVKAAG
jgi:hypothetical protein